MQTFDTTPGTRISREAAGIQPPDRRVADFVAPAAVDWVYDPASTDPAISENPFSKLERADLIAWLARERKWRYHHNVPELMENDTLYDAFVQRVDTMLSMCDNALASAELPDFSVLTAVDLASSEGFVATHFLERGFRSVDCLELSKVGIDRHLALQALSGTHEARVGRLDLELAAWAHAVERYDVVFALGIVYHLENPALFARNVYEITNHVALVESDTPSFPDNSRFRGHGVIYLNRDQVTLEAGNVRYLTEMRPDRVALAQLFLSAGFEEVAFVPPVHGSPYFERGEKTLMVCFRDAPRGSA